MAAFQAFLTGRVWVFGDMHKPFQCAMAADLRLVSMSLKDVLGRIPDLSSEYEATFSEPPLTLKISPVRVNWSTYVELSVSDREVFSDRLSLEGLAARIRGAFPALAKWRLVSANTGYGYSFLRFANVAPPISEFDEETLAFTGGTNYQAAGVVATDTAQPLELREALPPPAGGYSKNAAALIAPVNGHHIGEYSLHLMGAYLLSTLVRYRPRTWVRAITRAETKDEPGDDRALALVESFLEAHMEAMKGLVREILVPS